MYQFLKRLTQFLKNNPCLYTLLNPLYTRKITSKFNFSCSSRKKSVTLRPNEYFDYLCAGGEGQGNVDPFV